MISTGYKQRMEKHSFIKSVKMLGKDTELKNNNRNFT